LTFPFIKIFTDATARGNPGKSGIGIVIKDNNDNLLLTHKEFLGENTNNAGEYSALIKSLDLLNELKDDFNEIQFYLDSELVVKQLKGEYKIKNKDLIRLSIEFWKKVKAIGKNFELSHIPRSENKLADKLANEAVDEYLLQSDLNHDK
jgi:ribonuclease HI